MSILGLSRRNSPLRAPELGADDLKPSDAEAYYLWTYIQGSIMVPSVRWQLRRAWGMCERHSFIALAVEAAFRHSFLHGPSLLYDDIMEQALKCFCAMPFIPMRLAFQLRETKPCLMCEMGYGPHSRGTIMREYLAQGQNLEPIRAFARETEAYWRPTVCGACEKTQARHRCRVHLREDCLRGEIESGEQTDLVRNIANRVACYHQSFRWDMRDTETLQDRAALISAVGWCSGWRPWLVLMQHAGS